MAQKLALSVTRLSFRGAVGGYVGPMELGGVDDRSVLATLNSVASLQYWFDSLGALNMATQGKLPGSQSYPRMQGCQ